MLLFYKRKCKVTRQIRQILSVLLRPLAEKKNFIVLCLKECVRTPFWNLFFSLSDIIISSYFQFVSSTSVQELLSDRDSLPLSLAIIFGFK